MFKKTALTAIVAVTVLLTGCGSAAPRAETPSPAPAPAARAAKPVSLILDWYPNAVHSFVYAAAAQGYFKDEGLDVSIKMPAENPTDGIKLVGAGKETFAFYYQPDVLMARGEGIPVVSFAAVVRKPLNGIMVPTASGIKSPKDLEGKQVGYPGIALDVPLVRTMVKAAGGNPDKVTMTDVSFDLIPALETKRTAAIAGGFINHEKPVMEKEGTPITYFAPGDYGVPNYYELVLITGEQTIKTDKATVAAFYRALAKGQAWVKAHPDDALKLLLSKQEKEFPLDADIETKALQILLPLMEPFGTQSQDDWQKVADWMVAQNVIKADVKAADAFVDVTK